MFEEQVKAREEKLEAVVAGITPVLDCISFEPPEASSWVLGDLPHQSITDRYHTVWADFKEFTRSATHGAIIHALA